MLATRTALPDCRPLLADPDDLQLVFQPIVDLAGATAYAGERGNRVLAALEEIAGAHDVPLPAVALRWLADQPTVVAPIASGRSVEQLAQLLPMQDLELAEDELQALDEASR